MIERVQTAITKLQQTELLSQLAYVYFNTYFTKSIFFGYGIFELIE
jgi:hypothetical protein